MIAKILLIGFIVSGVPGLVISMYTSSVLERENVKPSPAKIFFIFTNLIDLKELTIRDKKYKRLYKYYLISLLLPVVYFIVLLIGASF